MVIISVALRDKQEIKGRPFAKSNVATLSYFPLFPILELMDWKSYIQGKNVTQLGLGLLGRGIGDAEFLSRFGANLIVTDLKTETELAESLVRLKHCLHITFHLGGHRNEDFVGRDFILKAAGAPFDSPFIAQARQSGIPIEMDASLFSKLAPRITLIGVTGTRGKSTVTILLYEMLKAAGKRVFLGGNIKDTATLPLLEKVQEGDYVVLELDSWQLQGFGESKISPNIAVFTTFLPDHMNYYKGDMDMYFNDKANIFRFQKKGDVLVVGEDIAPARTWDTEGEVFIARRDDVRRELTGAMVGLMGEHNQLNAACAVAAAEALKLPKSAVNTVLHTFRGLAGRLELRNMISGVAYYNDSNSTTPDAAIAALRTIGSQRKKNIILIMGGTDKQLDMQPLASEIPKWCKAVVLLSENGTEKFKPLLESATKQGVAVVECDTLPACVAEATSRAEKGDNVLFSPAFASFGRWFKNEYDRGSQFNRLIEGMIS